MYIFIEKFAASMYKILSEKVEFIMPFVKFFSPQKGPLIIHFEPWNYNSSVEILKQFFKTLANKLNSNDNKCFISVSKLITVYGKA